MTSSREPLPPSLASLVDHERARPGLSEAVRDRLRSRVMTSVAPFIPDPGDGGGDAPPSPPAAPAGGADVVGGAAGGAATTAGAGKLAVVALSSALLGSAITLGVQTQLTTPPRSLEARAVPRVTVVARTGSSVTNAVRAEDLPLEPPLVTSVGGKAARLASSGRAPRVGSGLAAERSLLGTARTALTRGNGSAALAALNSHARQFPRGQLREERESLWIQALALSGQGDEANARARSFKKTYPNSLLGPAVDETLRKASPRTKK